VTPIAFHRIPECRWALQTGPILVVTGRNVINQAEVSNRSAYRRSVAAVDRRGRVLLMATTEIHLYDLAACLCGELKQLEVRDAINLDGDSSSGLLVAVPGGAMREIGSTWSLIASAIAVVPRVR